MDKINLEILEYIDNADFDENVKSFLRSAIIYEIRNPGKMRYKSAYNKMIEDVL